MLQNYEVQMNFLAFLNCDEPKKIEESGRTYYISFVLSLLYFFLGTNEKVLLMNTLYINECVSEHGPLDVPEAGAGAYMYFLPFTLSIWQSFPLNEYTCRLNTFRDEKQIF